MLCFLFFVYIQIGIENIYPFYWLWCQIAGRYICSRAITLIIFSVLCGFVCVVDGGCLRRDRRIVVIICEKAMQVLFHYCFHCRRRRRTRCGYTYLRWGICLYTSQNIITTKHERYTERQTYIDNTPHIYLWWRTNIQIKLMCFSLMANVDGVAEFCIVVLGFGWNKNGTSCKG